MIVKDFTLPDAYHMVDSTDKFAPTLGSLIVHDDRHPDVFHRSYNLTINTVGMIRVECMTTREGIESLRDACNAALEHADSTGTLYAAPDPTTQD